MNGLLFLQKFYLGIVIGFLVIFIFIYGTYNLIMHKSFDFKHQRFIGYIFIALGILVFAHFRLHSIVQKRGGNFLKPHGQSISIIFQIQVIFI